MNEFKDVKDYIFEGFIYKTFKIDGVKVTLRTITEDERISILGYQHTTDTHFYFETIISLLAIAIIEINNKPVGDKVLLHILYNGNSNFIITLYDCYKQLFNKITDIYKLFDKFIETNESKQRWASFKYGYKFANQRLNPLQENWIRYNDVKENTDQYKIFQNLSDYIISHVTHATINPKTYVQRARNQRMSQQTDVEQGNVDLYADLKGNILKKDNEDDKNYLDRIRKYITDKITNRDEHDDSINNIEREKLKTLLRARKLKISKAKKSPTVIRKDIKVGMKQDMVLDREDIKKKIDENPYFINYVDYTDIMKARAFVDLPDRDEIFKVIIEEPDSKEIYYSNMKRLQDLEGIKSVKEDSHDKIIKKYEQDLKLNKSSENIQLLHSKTNKKDIKVGYKQSIDLGKVKLKDLIKGDGDIKDMNLNDIGGNENGKC